MFNVIRVLMEQSERYHGLIQAGWHKDVTWDESRESRRNQIVKVHEYDANVVTASDLVFYTFRDVRDSLASQLRKFGRVPTIDAAKKLIEDDNNWRACANVVVKYEDIREQPVSIIGRVAFELGIGDVDFQLINNRVEALNYESDGARNEQYNIKNLFHKNHVIDGRSGLWLQYLDKSLLRDISSKFGGWLEANGYPR